MKWFAAFAVITLSAALHAHEGEDHGGAAPAVSMPLAPRIEAHSPDFEIVAIVEKDALVIYLDRYATNEPMKGAKLEVEIAGKTVAAQERGEGVYVAGAGALSAPGKHDVVFSVQAGNAADLLPGTLTIAAPAENRTASRFPLKWVIPAVAVLLAALAALFLVRRRKRAHPALAMAAIALLFTITAGAAYAHGDEDHSKDEKKNGAGAGGTAQSPAAPAAGNAPVRLPDGSVFVPKPVQRQLGLRTMLAEIKDIAATVELKGHVVPDPNASGRVQAPQGGRLDPGPKGLPYLGQRVARGEVLAYLRPLASPIERGNQQAQSAELAGQLEIVEKKLKRYEQLEGSIPRKELENARAEVESLRARRVAVSGSINPREALAAPVSGIVSAAFAAAGQVVEAREVLFQIIDPQRLWIEAVAYDMALTGKIAAATGSSASGAPLKLTFLGSGYQLREQALPLQFRIESPAPPMSVGEKVKVFVQTRQTVTGVRVPQLAIARAGSGEPMVWVHVSAERFVPQKVKAELASGTDFAVTAGLKAADRVVTQGATLLSQVR